MPSRDPFEPHRFATRLELFFDLGVVVAVALRVRGRCGQLDSCTASKKRAGRCPPFA